MKKFKMLITLSAVLKTMGWISFIGGLAIGIWAIASPESLSIYGIKLFGDSSVIAGLAVMLVSIFYSIIFLALGELVSLFLAMEENLKQLKDFFLNDK